MLVIRQSTIKDLTTLASFQLQLAEESENMKLNKAIVTAGLQALFDDPSKGTYFVAEDGGTVCGCFLITFEWSDWRNGMIWWLQSVYVAATHRRQGVFKKMYDHIVESISRDPKIIGLRLYVDKTNARAQNVYQSMGMNGDHYTVFEWMKG
jgi:ribosomal protein S18 acetylase RimI-like enzyme